MVITLKIFSRTQKALRHNLDILHWGLKVYQVYSKDDPRMTFDIFMARSNLCLVLVVILEECCMASANMQWPFYQVSEF